MNEEILKKSKFGKEYLKMEKVKVNINVVITFKQMLCDLKQMQLIRDETFNMEIAAVDEIIRGLEAAIN